jgi:hypothetical protein
MDVEFDDLIGVETPGEAEVADEACDEDASNLTNPSETVPV